MLPSLDPRTVCFTVDVEWAAPGVLDDLMGIFNEHGVRATFFVTHAGVQTPGHERGLHPSFRRGGDTYKHLLAARGSDASLSDADVYAYVVSHTQGFAPEAKGVRTHSLYYDSTLLPIYQGHGLEYDCSYSMPLVEGLRPFWKHHQIIEIPTYYADHFDLMTGATGFKVAKLRLDRPGLKVFDLHPNIIFLNASTNDQYLATKAFYHDPERLLAARHSGRGARTFLLDVLESVRSRQLPVATVGEVNASWRTLEKWP